MRVSVGLGSKADTAVTATDTTPGSNIALLKGIISKLAGSLTVSTHAVTGSGNFASTVADGANTTLGAKADAAQALYVRVRDGDLQCLPCCS